MEALLVFKKQNPYVMSTLGMIHADKFIALDKECVEISGIWSPIAFNMKIQRSSLEPANGLSTQCYCRNVAELHCSSRVEQDPVGL